MIIRPQKASHIITETWVNINVIYVARGLIT